MMVNLKLAERCCIDIREEEYSFFYKWKIAVTSCNKKLLLRAYWIYKEVLRPALKVTLGHMTSDLFWGKKIQQCVFDVLSSYVLSWCVLGEMKAETP